MCSTWVFQYLYNQIVGIYNENQLEHILWNKGLVFHVGLLVFWCNSNEHIFSTSLLLFTIAFWGGPKL